MSDDNIWDMFRSVLRKNIRTYGAGAFRSFPVFQQAVYVGAEHREREIPMVIEAGFEEVWKKNTRIRIAR